MAGPFIWDAKKTKVTVGGVPMTGFADGSKVEFAPNGDVSSIQEGVDGESTISVLHTRTGKFTINLKGCAELNALCTSLYQAMINGEAFVVGIEVSGPQGTVASSFCVLATHPNIPIGREEPTMGWVFNACDVNMAWTGSIRPVDRFRP